MNKVIKFLILSDLALLVGEGFITPIFAVFLIGKIQGGNIEVVGFATAIYWIITSLVLIPAARFIDKRKGEKDDLLFVILGSILAGLAVFGYIFSYLPWHIYVLQGIYAIGMGLNVPGYTGIFTRHVNKGKEASGWGTRGALIGIGTGIAGALGGTIAQNFGFTTLFLIAEIFIIFSMFLPIFIVKEMKEKDGQAPMLPEIKNIQPPAPKE
jgi:MFS family permease